MNPPILIGTEIMIEDKIYMTNEAGGIEIIPKGKYHIKVTKFWYDYECGWRYHGELLDKNDIINIRPLLKTIYQDKNGRCNGKTVYFSQWDKIKRYKKDN